MGIGDELGCSRRKAGDTRLARFKTQARILAALEAFAGIPATCIRKMAQTGVVVDFEGEGDASAKPSVKRPPGGLVCLDSVAPPGLRAARRVIEG